MLVIGDDVFTIRRRNAEDWRTNIQRGAHAERTPLSAEHEELARRSAAAVGVPLAGVDLLPTQHGETLVLEVNAVPGWRAMSSTLEIDIAQRVLAFLVQARQGR